MGWYTKISFSKGRVDVYYGLFTTNVRGLFLALAFGLSKLVNWSDKRMTLKVLAFHISNKPANNYILKKTLNKFKFLGNKMH